ALLELSLRCAAIKNRQASDIGKSASKFYGGNLCWMLLYLQPPFLGHRGIVIHQCRQINGEGASRRRPRQVAQAQRRDVNARNYGIIPLSPGYRVAVVVNMVAKPFPQTGFEIRPHVEELVWTVCMRIPVGRVYAEENCAVLFCVNAEPRARGLARSGQNPCCQISRRQAEWPGDRISRHSLAPPATLC